MVMTLSGSGIREIDFRGLRAVVAAADAGGINRASEGLHVSQPALSRIIRVTERTLGATLFVRGATGVSPTPAGDLVMHRFRRSLRHLAEAEAELDRLDGATGVDRSTLSRLLGRRHMRALIETAECESVSFAARRLGISASAVHRALRECETIAGARLLERRQHRTVPTEAGEFLVRRAKLALAELRYAREELDLHQGSVAGRVAIGSLPLSRTVLVPRTITRLAANHPGLKFSIIDGPYPSLLHGLRCGDLDLIVGALRHPVPVEDVMQEALFEDPLSIIARPGHPLVARAAVDIAELAEWPWVVPRVGTPTRARFNDLFRAAGVRPPDDAVESSSLVAIRALLAESDCLTILSRHQVQYEERLGVLAVLPLQLDQTRRAIGITTRADTEPPPGLRAFIDALHAICRELYPCGAADTGSGASETPTGDKRQ